MRHLTARNKSLTNGTQPNAHTGVEVARLTLDFAVNAAYLNKLAALFLCAWNFRSIPRLARLSARLLQRDITMTSPV